MSSLKCPLPRSSRLRLMESVTPEQFYMTVIDRRIKGNYLEGSAYNYEVKEYHSFGNIQQARVNINFGILPELSIFLETINNHSSYVLNINGIYGTFTEWHCLDFIIGSMVPHFGIYFPRMMPLGLRCFLVRSVVEQMLIYKF